MGDMGKQLVFSGVLVVVVVVVVSVVGTCTILLHIYAVNVRQFAVRYT